MTDNEVEELKNELDREICSASNDFHRKQLEIQRRFLDNEGVGNMELIMVPRVFASRAEANTSYISLVASLPVREHTVFRSGQR